MDLLLDRGLRQGQHGVVGVEHPQLLAPLLELFQVDGDRVSRAGGDVGNVQLFQVGAVSLQWNYMARFNTGLQKLLLQSELLIPTSGNPGLRTGLYLFK